MSRTIPAHQLASETVVRSSKPKRVLFPVLAIAVAALGAALLLVNSPQLTPEPVQPLLVSVKYLTAQSTDLRLIVISQGTVQPRTEANLVPEVSGKVVSMSPAMVSGGRFAEGEILFKIDDRDYLHAQGRAEAELERAEADLQFSGFEYERLASLQERDLTSRSLAEEAQRAFRNAEALLKEARINVERAALDLERTEIRAPFTGRVRSESIDVGQFVSRGSSIAVLYATEYVEIRLPIADRQLAYMKIESLAGLAGDADAARVRLSASLGGRTWFWDGRLLRTEGEIDVTSRMIHGVARVENPRGREGPPLPVGLFVNAEIEGRLAEGVFVLPRVAMRDNNRVLVIDEEDRLHFRQVEVMRIESETVIISDGLRDGDRVCVSKLQTVVESMPVRASESDWTPGQAA